MRVPEPTPLVVCGLLGIASGILVAVVRLPVVSAVAGLLLALALPGYAAMRLLFRDDRLDRTERVCLSLGLSVSVAIGCGVLLHLTTVGLHAASWGVVLGALTAGVAAAAWYARERPLASRPAAPSVLRAPGAVEIPAAQTALLLAAVLVTVLSVLLARGGALAQPHPGFTALSVLSEPSGSAVRIGIENREGRDMVYRLAVVVNDAVVARLDELPVMSNATEVRLAGLPPGGRLLREVRVQLWRGSDALDAPPYREVRATVRASAGATSSPAP